MMKTSRHRPPDPELLERYVLNRLDQRERTEVEDLVRASREWREALRREEMLAAGVRRLGRAGLRLRISERLRVPSYRAIPWPRIALAAAVMCIIVGVGIVNRWFVPSPQPDTVILDQLAETEEAAEPDQTTADQFAGEDLAAVEKKGAPEATRSAGSERRDKAEGQLEEKNRYEGESRVRAPAAGGQEVDLDDQTPSSELSESPPTTAGRTASVFWTQGQLLAAEAEGLEKQAPMESKEALAQNRRASDDEGLGARRSQEFKAVGEVRQSIALQQKPFSKLDETRQESFHQEAGRLIPTLIEQRGDSLFLTLYPDFPFSDSEMQMATALPVTSDSLVVTVGSQQIGYRLPEIFLQTQHAKTQR